MAIHIYARTVPGAPGVQDGDPRDPSYRAGALRLAGHGETAQIGGLFHRDESAGGRLLCREVQVFQSLQSLYELLQRSNELRKMQPSRLPGESTGLVDR